MWVQPHHTGDKSYQCAYCWKEGLILRHTGKKLKVTHQHNFKWHILTHTLDKLHLSTVTPVSQGSINARSSLQTHIISSLIPGGVHDQVVDLLKAIRLWPITISIIIMLINHQELITLWAPAITDHSSLLSYQCFIYSSYCQKQGSQIFILPLLFAINVFSTVATLEYSQATFCYNY